MDELLLIRYLLLKSLKDQGAAYKIVPCVSLVRESNMSLYLSVTLSRGYKEVR